MHGDTQLSKSSPLKHIKSFLSEYSPEYKYKWVVLDNEMNFTTILKSIIFSKSLPTNPDASFENGPVECDHCTVS